MHSGVPHELQHTRKFGRSPGNGTTAMPMSRTPLASEGEATPGPDDYNPYDEREEKLARAELADDPTDGRDPYVFDDVGGVVDDVNLPGGDRAPTVEAPTFQSVDDLVAGPGRDGGGDTDPTMGWLEFGGDY